MCGNEISSVSNPNSNSEFYSLVATQIPSGRVFVKNFPMSPAHGTELCGMNLGGIKELRLQKCRINHETIQSLARVNMPTLQKLGLNDNELGPIGCRILAKSSLLERLTDLSINNNKIKDAGLKELASAGLPFIEDLSLNENSITSEGLKILPGKLDSIECLSLGSNKLTDSAVATINAINPESIYFIKLSRNEFTEEGMKKMIEANKNLDVLLIERNKVKGQKDKYKKKDLFLFY